MIKKISEYLTMIIDNLYSEKATEEHNEKVLHTILEKHHLNHICSLNIS